MTEEIPIVGDIAKIRSVDELRMVIKPLDVIFALQRGKPDYRSIVYGKQYVRTIASGAIGNQKAAVGGILIDFNTDELEQLCAAVVVVKGFHEYGFGKEDGVHTLDDEEEAPQ